MLLVKWLLRQDTRHARLVVLRLRLRALRYGDDFAETYLALHALIFGVGLLLPGSTTAGSKAWHVLAELLHGDVGIGALFLALGVALALAALRLVEDTVRRAVLVITISVWVGMAVGFFVGFPRSLGPPVAALDVLAAWVAYVRADR